MALRPTSRTSNNSAMIPPSSAKTRPLILVMSTYISQSTGQLIRKFLKKWKEIPEYCILHIIKRPALSPSQEEWWQSDYGSQDCMQSLDHGCTSSIEHLYSYVSSTSCLSNPKACHNLSDLISKRDKFHQLVNQHIFTIKQQAAAWAASKAYAFWCLTKRQTICYL